MSFQTYLITGADKGIGLELLKVLILRPSTTIAAGVRSTTSSASISSAIPLGLNSKVVPLHIDSSIEASPLSAATELRTLHGITAIDVLVANAGISEVASYAPVESVSADWVRKQIEVNTIGPLLLFQAFKPFLDTSPAPKFFIISSMIGSIGEAHNFPFPSFAYGVSKTAVNCLAKETAMENEKTVVLTLSPGWVRTHMGSAGAKAAGMEEAPTSVEKSVDGLLGIMDLASLQQTGRSFGIEKGLKEAVPW